VLADFPLLTQEGGVTNDSLGQGHFSAQVFQLTPGTDDPVVDLRISSTLEHDAEGIRLYRAVPIPSFWPSDVTVDRR
jgi:hypothetical protein